MYLKHAMFLLYIVAAVVYLHLCYM
jgi:hypothetical protein